MAKHEDIEVLKIQTHVLKVNMHCDGCKLKVKKILHKIEGVLSVSIDASSQKVTVSGTVNPEILVRKLTKAGKHAQLWSQKSTNQNQKANLQQKQTGITGKDEDKQEVLQSIEGLKDYKQKKTDDAEDYEDDDDCYEEEYEDDDDNDNELKLLEDTYVMNAQVASCSSQTEEQGGQHENSVIVASMQGYQDFVRDNNMMMMMMYLTSPDFSLCTEYYNCYPAPYNHLSGQAGDGDYTHLFSDENTKSCSIM